MVNWKFVWVLIFNENIYMFFMVIISIVLLLFFFDVRILLEWFFMLIILVWGLYVNIFIVSNFFCYLGRLIKVKFLVDVIYLFLNWKVFLILKFGGKNIC